jgi:hypothetical protein
VTTLSRSMQYETIFDVHHALPSRWGGMVFGLAVIALFMFGRFRPASLESPQFQQLLLTNIPAFLRPHFLWRRLMPMLRLLVLSIIPFAIVLAPKWLWGVAAGAAIFAFSAYGFLSSRNQILALRNAKDPQIVEGVVAKLGYHADSRGRGEYFNVGSRHFAYSEDDVASPYSLTLNSRSIADGQHVRISLVGDRIVKVERQLCLVYPRCKVSYFFGIRSETELPPA